MSSASIISMIFVITVLFIWIFIVFIARKTVINWNKIKKAIQNFNYSPSDQAVQKIINTVNKIGSIPNSPSCWDTMRATNKLIGESESVSSECKKEFRKFLLTKGVNVR